nr:PadR family transcriptional regulator [Gordonia araii]
MSREERDLPALAVLALLTLGPRHPYDIHRFVVQTRKDFVTGAPRSIYHAVQRLQRGHLIEPIGSEQDGGRPERTVFALTDAGRAEGRRRVAKLLATPQPDRTLTVAALSFLGILSRDDALLALRARIAALASDLAVKESELAEAGGLPPILLIEAEYECDQLRAEKAWVTDLSGRLESGELPWVPSGPLSSDL